MPSLVKKELLAYLACPRCHANLSIKAVTETTKTTKGAQEIVGGMLQCAGGHQFPVVRGVPRLVESELSGQTDIHTGIKFSESWEQFSRWHHDYIRQFFDWLAPINESFVKDKIVLDAGCGKGRHARVVAECGARVVIATDIGPSVDVAYRNLQNYDNVHVVQGDIKALPVKPIFEFVYSTGVLHHMDNPALGFKSLYKILNHEGAMAVWVYGRENNWWITSIINPIRQLITSRLPRQVLRVISQLLAAIVYFAARNIYKPWRDLRTTNSYLPPLFYEAYMAYIAKFDFEEIDHIVYDHLVAPVAYYLARDEVKSWAEDTACAFSQIRWHNQNSWTLVVSRNLDDREKIRGNKLLAANRGLSAEIALNASPLSRR